MPNTDLIFHSLAGPQPANLGRYAHGALPPRLMVGTERSPKLRPVPLSRDQLLSLAAKAIEIVQKMDRDAQA